MYKYLFVQNLALVSLTQPFVFMLSVPFQPKTTRNIHVPEQGGLSTFALKQNRHMGNAGLVIGLGLWLENLGESLRNWRLMCPG